MKNEITIRSVSSFDLLLLSVLLLSVTIEHFYHFIKSTAKTIENNTLKFRKHILLAEILENIQNV